MRLVTIDEKYLKQYCKDKEMLQKSKRPCALVIQLKYKEHRYDFAIPLRSNIAGSVPREQYFPLPPRRSTESTRRHGLHYIKMFPVKRNWLLKYHTESIYSALIKSIIDLNEKIIIAACKSYLQDYEKGIIPNYATNLDFLIEQMNKM